MKKLCLLLLFITSTSVFAQSLHLFDIDASAFPTVRAKFLAFDKDGNQMRPSINDLSLTENGANRTITNVSCPAEKPIPPISTVLVMDASGSMGGGGLEIAKTAANVWINGMPMNKSECAIVSFDEQNYFIQDFSTNKQLLHQKVNSLFASGGTDYDQAFYLPLAGGLEVTKTAKNKPVIIILTDGLPNREPNINEIVSIANSQNCSIFAVTVGMPCPNNLKEITSKTGGTWFENINTIEQSEDVYRKILAIAQSTDPCTIEWESGTSCMAGITNVELRIMSLNINAKTNYLRPNNSVATLEFEPPFYSFKNPELGVALNKVVKVTAKYADFNVSNITLNNNKYSVSPTNLNFKKGESKEITVSYMATDSSYTFCKFEFHTDMCPATYYISGGYYGVPPTQKTLEITKPSSGDKYIVGSDSIVTWKGIAPTDTVSLEYSIDNGATWNPIIKNASDLRYLWKNIPKPASNQCKIRAIQLQKTQNTLSEAKILFDLRGHTGSVYHISWSPDGSRVATCDDKTGIIWDANNGIKLLTLSGHTAGVYHISWSPDGSQIATASYDNTGIIWDANSGNKLHTLSGHIGFVYQISWSPDGSRVATASWDNTGIIWDASTGTKLHTLNGHTDDVKHISWSPDGSRVATASWDNTGIIWDASTGTKLHTLNGHTEYLNHISWSPDGSRVATSSGDMKGVIWDANTGSKLHTLGHTLFVHHISWSPDGSRVATASGDKTGCIWDASTGSKLQTLSGHSDVVIHVSWSPDGNRVATASRDNTSMIWDANTGAILHKLIGHTNDVLNISWSPDGTRVATASYDGTAKIWFVNNPSSVVQEDESDVFSIVEPIASSLDIDMKLCLVGKSKDLVVSNFVQNTGSWKFRVDSIYFIGSDAGAFSLVSGVPEYTIDAGNSHHAEFRFQPSEARVYNAQVVVITQNDTLVQDIRGEGVLPQFEVFSGVLDFGIVELGEQRTLQDTVLLRNIGENPLTITDTKFLIPYFNQFHILSGGGSFTLNKGEERRLTVQFKPAYGGRTSGRIGFEFNGAGSPAVVQLFGTGIGGMALVADDSAYASDKINLRLQFENIKPEGIKELAMTFSADIKFQGTILTPVDKSLITSCSNDSTTITIRREIPNSNIFAEIPMIVGLGNVEQTTLEVSNFKLYDALGQPLDYEVEYGYGIFKLLGICREGGTRLINPSAIAEKMQISPNPSEGNVKIEFNLIEEGSSRLKVYNSMGELVESFDLEPMLGKHHHELNTNDYGSGLYIIVLETPTLRQSEQLILMK